MLNIFKEAEQEGFQEVGDGYLNLPSQRLIPVIFKIIQKSNLFLFYVADGNVRSTSY